MLEKSIRLEPNHKTSYETTFLLINNCFDILHKYAPTSAHPVTLLWPGALVRNCGWLHSAL